MRRYSNVLFLALLLSILISGSRALAQNDDVLVRLLIFSGRADPFVLLHSDEFQSFEDRIVMGAELYDVEAGTPVIASRLGYKGFVIVKPHPNNTEDSIYYEVFLGKISLDESQYFIDENFAFESELLSLMLEKEAIDQEIYDFVEQERVELLGRRN